ncbi:Las1-domain-containing protein [Neoconidiobolus thromboides FSU 785]|nr:Las1-domain-containing protein [Neoconidiobolus thromboides FSU 785]
MKFIPTIVPWTNIEEFQSVKEALFPISKQPNNDDKLLWALKRIKAWYIRGKLPCSIECSMLFYQVIIKDYEQQVKNFNDIELRMLYSMALIRFVNGIIDPEQTSKYAKPIHIIAKNIQLPPKFVMLRHTATHGNLPKIQILRDYAKEALEWLNVHYWNKIIHQSTEDVEIVNNLLISYKQLRKAWLKDNEEEDGMKLVGKEKGIVMNFFRRKNINLYLNLIINNLIQPSFLIPQRKKKRPTKNNLKLDKNQLNLWLPLMKLLAEKYQAFLEALLLALIDKLESIEFDLSSTTMDLLGLNNSDKNQDLDDSYMLSLVAWSKEIISLSFNLEENFEQIELDYIIHICLRKPNIYTLMILNHIYSLNSNLIDDFKNQLQLVKLIINSKKSISKHEIDDNNFKSITKKIKNSTLEIIDMETKYHEFINTNKLELTNNEAKDLSINNIYPRLVNSMEFNSNAPLGALNETSYPDLELPLEWDELPAYLPPFLKN